MSHEFSICDLVLVGEVGMQFDADWALHQHNDRYRRVTLFSLSRYTSTWSAIARRHLREIRQTWRTRNPSSAPPPVHSRTRSVCHRGYFVCFQRTCWVHCQIEELFEIFDCDPANHHRRESREDRWIAKMVSQPINHVELWSAGYILRSVCSLVELCHARNGDLIALSVGLRASNSANLPSPSFIGRHFCDRTHNDNGILRVGDTRFAKFFFWQRT